MSTNISFEEIYNEHKNLVYNLSLNYVQNKEEAEDITQEVFVKVYRNLGVYDPSASSVKTWIYRITVNQCLDFIKLKKSKKRSGFLTSLFHADTNDPIPEAVQLNHPGIAAEDKEELNSLLLIINSLPENQKTAIILTKIEDRPQQEVAEIMNTSVKAIESLLQRAKQNIAKKLTDTEG